MGYPRIKWIDTARAFGIFFIYLGHFGEEAGMFYPWVYSFHVQLFFFLSGCTEQFNHRNIIDNLKHRAWTILVPFYSFGLLNILWEQILYHPGNAGAQLLSLASGGIRNQIQDGYGLWFLTCLFCISILFSFLKKLPEKTLLPVSVGIFLFADLFLLKGTYADFPRLPYNLDDALYYQLWYAIGYLSVHVVDHLFLSKKKKVTAFRMILISFLLCVSMLSLTNGNLFYYFAHAGILNETILRILQPEISILPVLYYSSVFSESKFLGALGRRSLYLCGNEFIIRDLARIILPATYSVNQWSCLLYAFLLCTAAWLLSFPEKCIADLVTDQFVKKPVLVDKGEK